MPQGDKSSYTDKQKRQAANVEAGYEQRGASVKTAEARAWATREQTFRRRQHERLRQEESQIKITPVYEN